MNGCLPAELKFGENTAEAPGPNHGPWVFPIQTLKKELCLKCHPFADRWLAMPAVRRSSGLKMQYTKPL